jgi:hypothetical protein
MSRNIRILRLVECGKNVTEMNRIVRSDSGVEKMQLNSPPPSLNDKTKRLLAITLAFLSIAIGGARAYTLSGSTYTTNGSQSDVQSAINAAPTGATVLIPAGSFSWSSPVTVSTNIALKGAGTSSTTLVSGNNGLLVISNPTPFASQVSGITFNCTAATNAPQAGVDVKTPTLLHDCVFNANGGIRMVLFEVNGSVLWNWTFYDNDKNDEAIGFKKAGDGPGGQSTDWSSNDTMGMSDKNGTANTYVENCTFNQMVVQALDLDDNSRVVIRYCTFNNSGFSSHGLDTSPYGMRQWEIYNNTFVFSKTGTDPAGNAYPLNINWWFYVRGGTGVIFNNVMPDISSQQWGNKASVSFTVFNIQRSSAYIPCQTKWQAIHQVGQGYSTSAGGLFLDPVYMWGNTGGTNYNTLQLNDYPDECGNGLKASQFIQLNRDVYIGTPKPGYTPYTYPHPLRTGGVQSTPTPNSTPAAPQNLRVQ